MKTSEAIAYYADNKSELARVCGVDQSTVYSWGEFPPDKHQLRLERITKGAIKAEPGCRQRALGMEA